MPDWQRLFGDTTVVQALLWIAAAGALIVVVVKLWPFVRNAVAIVDALVLLPALVKQVESMRAQVDGIHHETHKNDGSSIKDAVGRVEEGVAGLHGRMDDVDRQLVTLAREDEALWAELDNTNDSEEE
ncbi:hypothetical protein [Microbacterium allomyrinae]|uniref:DUF2746 domain-containing protein n=1 Tax=Microbacterium allomyrinae TaxID=2830666 RepID=A0A9X1LTS6_9MICO|nr:hypothetical protein [Microbacterium allomyrinae]MCC2031839.1 hypothetical protein [Microbacterium allomyrinae]